jgi:phage-related protein (TIGR01555 family)
METERQQTSESMVRTLVRSLPQRARAVAQRVDGWVNVVSGLGSALTDKVANTLPASFEGLSYAVLSDMFHADATVRKACEKRPRDALRKGFRVSVPDEAGGVDTSTAIQDAADALDAVARFREACTWENLYGGCVIMLGVDDGRTGIDSQTLPLELERVRRLIWLRVVDARKCQRSWLDTDVDDDPESPDFGQPTHYMLRLDAKRGTYARVHRDRLIVFPGMLTAEEIRAQRGGWGISVIDPVYEALQRNVTAWQSAGSAMSNAQYVVYRLKGLAHMFSLPNGEESAKKRAQAMEMAKSMISAILIDADDEYTRENPNFGNMPDMLDAFMLDAASALDMPATVLWGRSPAGENATGESDLQLWNADLLSYQEHHLRPRLQRFVEVLLASKEGPTGGQQPDGWRVYFPPLRELSDTEKADVRLKTSQADASDITNGVLLPQEVAKSRYRPEGYSIETTIDMELRDRLLEKEVEAREREIDAQGKPLELGAPGEPMQPGGDSADQGAV